MRSVTVNLYYVNILAQIVVNTLISDGFIGILAGTCQHSKQKTLIFQVFQGCAVDSGTLAIALPAGPLQQK